MITIIVSIYMQQVVLESAMDVRYQCEDAVQEELWSGNLGHWGQVNAMTACQRPFTKY